MVVVKIGSKSCLAHGIMYHHVVVVVVMVMTSGDGGGGQRPKNLKLSG